MLIFGLYKISELGNSHWTSISLWKKGEWRRHYAHLCQFFSAAFFKWASNKIKLSFLISCWKCLDNFFYFIGFVTYEIEILDFRSAQKNLGRCALDLMICLMTYKAGAWRWVLALYPLDIFVNSIRVVTLITFVVLQEDTYKETL